MTKSHKKHITRLHKYRLGWFFGLAAALLTIQFAHLNLNNAGQVLAYAVNVSHGELANLTNQKRAQHGLPALTLHSQLNNAAQAKAGHMVAHNYWAHTAPDGTEPWTFFDQAGYPYVHAGENLAYGFADSAEILDAWMNSPGHAANILGDYKDMGFGITNGSSYQGGQYTVVAAFYGTQSAPTPPPAPVVAAAPAAPSPPTNPEPTPAPAPQPETVETSAPPTQTNEPEPVAVNTGEPSNSTAAPQRITNFQNILGGNANWMVYASLSVVGASTIGFAATHRQLVKRGWQQSAHFILVHPLVDLAVLATIVGIILASTAGFIR